MEIEQYLSGKEFLQSFSKQEEQLTPLELYGLELSEPIDPDHPTLSTQEQLKLIENRVVESHKRNTIIRSN